MNKRPLSSSSFLGLVCLCVLVSCVSYDQEVDTSQLPKYKLGTVAEAQQGTVYNADEVVQEEKPDSTKAMRNEADEQIAILRQQVGQDRIGVAGPPPGHSSLVGGYNRSDGTYVAPHYRSAAGGSPYADDKS